MKSILIVWFICLTAITTAQDSASLTIIVNAAELKDTSAIFITGNTKEFGTWNPGLIKLSKFSDTEWKREFSFKKGRLLEYKFTKGSWETEAVDTNGNTPGNYRTVLNGDTTIRYTISAWKDQFEESDSVKGQITGRVKYYRNLKYENLLPRDIIVWLPPGYESEKDRRYPVLYMQDGQNIVDPATSSFGVDWQIDEAADSLIKQNQIEPIIIVGIYNTKDRTSEYTPTNKGYKYMEFIVNKLKPFVDSKYRTKPERQFTAAGGSSAGGIISFMLLWHYNNTFSKVICMSPAFKIIDDDNDIQIDYVSDVSQYSGAKKDIKLYIYNGGLGLEKLLQPGVDEMIDELKLKGYNAGIDYIFIKNETAEHNESAWAERIPEALKFIFTN